MNIPKEFKHKVKLPKWWDDKQPIGYTDKVDTYCCEPSPSWFVLVPDYDYYGYFGIEDLEIIEQ